MDSRPSDSRDEDCFRAEIERSLGDGLYLLFVQRRWPLFVVVQGFGSSKVRPELPPSDSSLYSAIVLLLKVWPVSKVGSAENDRFLAFTGRLILPRMRYPEGLLSFSPREGLARRNGESRRETPLGGLETDSDSGLAFCLGTFALVKSRCHALDLWKEERGEKKGSALFLGDMGTHERKHRGLWHRNDPF